MEQLKVAHDESLQDRVAVFSSWQLLASRDACMSIYHFGRARDGLHETLGSCLYIKDRLDRAALRNATKLFDAHFPHYVQMRHAIAHHEETKNTLKAQQKHAFQDGETEIVPGIKIKGESGGRIMMTGNLFNRTFQMMWEGTVLTCDMIPETGKNLAEVRDHYFSVFKAIRPPP